MGVSSAVMPGGLLSPSAVLLASLLVCACGRTALSTASLDCTGVDLQTDNENCGRCSNRCSAVSPSTATCTGGRCLVTLASDAGNPYGIAVDAKAVYWTGGTAVMKVPKIGGKPVTVVGGQTGWPFALRADDRNVYWVNWGRDQNDAASAGYHATVMQAPKSGGSAIMLASEQPQAFWGFAVDATSVYWTVNPSLDYASGSIMKVAIGGGTPMALATNQYDPTGLAVDATSVYWTTQDYTLMKVGIDGGTPVRLAYSGGPVHVAVSDGSVYTFKDGDIVKVSVLGGDPTTLASLPGYAQAGDITVDETSVYWTQDDGVLKVGTDGAEPTILVSGQANPQAIAVDDTSIYWTDPYASTVIKLSPK